MLKSLDKELDAEESLKVCNLGAFGFKTEMRLRVMIPSWHEEQKAGSCLTFTVMGSDSRVTRQQRIGSK